MTDAWRFPDWAFLSMPISGLLAALVACPGSSPSFEIVCSDGAYRLSAEQILRYEWPSHVLWVTPRTWEEFFGTGGARCDVRAQGEVAYSAEIVPPVVSSSRDGVVFTHAWDARESNPDEYAIEIRLGYPSEEHYSGRDPRSDPAVREALRQSGILVEAGTAIPAGD